MLSDEARAVRQDNEDMQGEMPFFHMPEKCHQPITQTSIFALRQSNQFSSLRRQ
jgi:hypothetical protein